MKAGIVGATGYLGAELLRLLSQQDRLDVVTAQAASSAGAALSDVLPSLASAYPTLAVEPLDTAALSNCEVVFVALPSGASQQVIGELVGDERVVVDLGADFRLKDAGLYPTWYGFEHARPDLLDCAVYGLPELTRNLLPDARLIAAPGCYVTAAALALHPFVSRGLVSREGLIIDATSGTSGAGKEPKATLHHPLVNERLVPYGVPTHRHTPEMEQVLGARVLFTPHLAPMTRGILATCYARTAGGLSSSEQVLEVLRQDYVGEPFVHVSSEFVSTAEAYGSNVAHLSGRYDERTGVVVIFAAIDNLIKGGAGQAIQAANVALGLPETAGLPLAGLTP